MFVERIEKYALFKNPQVSPKLMLNVCICMSDCNFIILLLAFISIFLFCDFDIYIYIYIFSIYKNIYFHI